MNTYYSTLNAEKCVCYYIYYWIVNTDAFMCKQTFHVAAGWDYNYYDYKLLGGVIVFYKQSYFKYLVL